MTFNTSENVKNNIHDSYASLDGAGVGGGLFLIAVVLGVIFWITREREEDEEARMEAEKFMRGRTRGILVDPKERPLKSSGLSLD